MFFGSPEHLTFLRYEVLSPQRRYPCHITCIELHSTDCIILHSIIMHIRHFELSSPTGLVPFFSGIHCISWDDAHMIEFEASVWPRTVREAVWNKMTNPILDTYCHQTTVNLVHAVNSNKSNYRLSRRSIQCVPQKVH